MCRRRSERCDNRTTPGTDDTVTRTSLINRKYLVSCTDVDRSGPTPSAIRVNLLAIPLAAVGHLIAVLAKQPLIVALRAKQVEITGAITTGLHISSCELWRTESQQIVNKSRCLASR
jgi:hypothetical protein